MAGRVPFSADSAYATIHEQIYIAPPPPSQFDGEITPAVEAVLLKALEKDPQQRYHSATELIQALEDALNASGLRALDPNRARNAVPVGDTSRDIIPPAVKTSQTQQVPPAVPPATVAARDARSELDIRFEDNPGAFVGQMANRAAQSFNNTMNDQFDNVGDNRTRSEQRRDRRSDRRDRFNHGWMSDNDSGIYSVDDPRLAGMSDDERIRKIVEKRIEERNGLLIHFGIYLAVNLGIFFASGFEFGALVPAFFWGIGMFAHFMSYYSKYGAGRDRREALIQREIAKERELRYGSKAKNEELVDTDEVRRIRLTGDGELTESFVEDLSQGDDARRKRR
jgi:hypothetical protein